MSIVNRAERVEWFGELADRLGIAQEEEFDLLHEVEFPAGQFAAIRSAALAYICACLGEEPGVGEQDVLERAVTGLANRTPNGVLMPKREFQAEFNALQNEVVGWLKGLGIEDMVYRICCPIVVRLAKGERNEQEERRPYSSSKLHTDIWSGEPFDHVGVRIPVLGDIERTALEYFHPPADFEESYQRHLADYDEARELQERANKYPVTMRHGYAYLVDGSVLHQTVKKGGGARVTLQVELRRSTSDESREMIEGACDPDRLSYYIDRDDWFELGSGKTMEFKDTYADALKGIFIERTADEQSYDLVGRQ